MYATMLPTIVVSTEDNVSYPSDEERSADPAPSADPSIEEFLLAVYGLCDTIPPQFLDPIAKKRAERLASMGEYSKAVTALSAGKVAPPSAENYQILLDKHPQQARPAPSAWVQSEEAIRRALDHTPAPATKVKSERHSRHFPSPVRPASQASPLNIFASS